MDHVASDRGAPTMAQFVRERWLPIQRTRLRATTFDSYRRNLELHVLPHLGDVVLAELEVHDLDRLYAHLLERGRRGPVRGGLSPKTVRSVHLIVHKVLRDAVRKELVERNVAASADAPTARASRAGGPRVWGASQLARFLEVAATHRLGPALHLAAHTGMRRGEVLGLRWGDLDLERSRLAITQTLVSVAYELHTSDAKTSTGRRSVDLDDGTVRVLRAWQATRRAECGGTSVPMAPDRLVFTREDGAPVHPDTFSKLFERLVARAGLPVLSLHDLRHTHATLLLASGVPVKVVSERLGHASPAFTMATYQHLLPGMQAEAAATFARMVADAPPAG